MTISTASLGLPSMTAVQAVTSARLIRLGSMFAPSGDGCCEKPIVSRKEAGAPLRAVRPQIQPAVARSAAAGVGAFVKGLVRHASSLFRSPEKSFANASEKQIQFREPS